MKTAAVASMVMFVLTRVTFADLSSATFTAVFDMRDVTPDNRQGSFFYLNDNVNSSGNVLAGQIGWGAWEVDPNGEAENFIKTNQTLTKDNTGVFFTDTDVPRADRSPPIGAKSAVRIGSFNFMATNNNAGIARFPAVGAGAWDPTDINPINGGLRLGPNGEVRLLEDAAGNLFAAESLATTAQEIPPPVMTPLMFTNESGPGSNTARVHAYEVQSNIVDFTLNHAWTTDVATHPDLVNPDPRFRGLAYGENGFVYGVDTGNGGSGSVWAFDITDGAATKVTDFTDADGTGDSFLVAGIDPVSGDPIFEPIQGFGAMAHEDELWVFGNSGQVSAFDLASPTTVGDRTDLDFGQMLFDAGAAENPDVAIFGMAADDDTVWVSYESRGEGSNRRIGIFSIAPGAGLAEALPGDANLDGEVSFADFLIVQTYFDQPGGWEQGDFNGDGQVSFIDYLILQTHMGERLELDVDLQEIAGEEIFAVATPEPTTLGLIAIAGLAWIRPRRPQRV